MLWTQGMRMPMPGRFHGASGGTPTNSNLVFNQRMYWHHRDFINRFIGYNADMEPGSSIPSGYAPPYTWAMSLETGGVANISALLQGTGSVTADLTAGSTTVSDIDATIAGTSSVSAELLGPMKATLSGSGSVTADVVGDADISAHIGVTDRARGSLIDPGGLVI